MRGGPDTGAISLDMLLLLACASQLPDSAAPTDSEVVVDSEDTGDTGCGHVLFTTESAVFDYTDAFQVGEPVTLEEDGTLEFCPGTWFVLLTIEATIEIVGGSSDAAETVLSGGESGTVLLVEGESLSLDDVTVDRGVARDEGNLGSGAGVRCDEGGTVRATNTVFSNHSAYDGAGMYGGDGCHLEVEDSIFRNNVVDDDGGAFRVDFGTASLRNVDFEDNEARDGGAMILQDSDVVIEGGAFRRNVVRDTQGGAVLHYWGTLSVTGTSFEDNEANSAGGAMALFGDTALESVSFTGNSTDSGGGLMVYTDAGTLRCTDCSFSGNSPDDVATDLGGSYTYPDVASFVCDTQGCQGE